MNIQLENENPIWKWNWGISDEKKVVCKTARRAHSQKIKGTIEFSLKLQKGSATAQNTRNMIKETQLLI